MRGINGDLYLVVADAVPLNGAVGAEHIAAERIDVLEDVRDFCAYLIIAAVEDDAAVVHAAENGLAAEELSALGEGEAGFDEAHCPLGLGFRHAAHGRGELLRSGLGVGHDHVIAVALHDGFERAEHRLEYERVMTSCVKDHLYNIKKALIDRGGCAGIADLVPVSGGLNVEPLAEMIDRLIDEDAVRTSPIHFGLVMTELGSLRSVQCPIEDIPEGQLKDYMLASSACFPALRPREIDGVKYIDGGWRDNMPLDLAARMGATELLGVDVDGIGIVRPNTTGLPTRIVRSHWDLGPTLDFDPARAGRNIALGYFDTLRLFGRCGGTAYAMLPDNEEYLAHFAERYQKNLAEVCARAPEIDLVEKNARTRANYPAPYAPNPSAPTRGALAPLELAAERVGVPEDIPYTPKLLAATFMGSFDKDPADRFPALLEGKENTLVTERAIAAAVPEEFVTALVSKTLSEMPIL